MSRSREPRPPWGVTDVLAWGGAILVVLLASSHAWSPDALGFGGGGSVRNSAPTLAWANATTLRAFDANSESDLFDLQIVSSNGTTLFVSFAIPVQGFALDGRAVLVRVLDDPAPHDGFRLLSLSASGGAPPVASLQVLDKGGARSAVLSWGAPAPPPPAPEPLSHWDRAALRGLDGRRWAA